MKALMSIPKAGPDHLARAAFAEFVACAKGQAKTGGQVLRQLYPNDTEALRILQRAAVDPATTTGSGWADTLVQTAVRAFLGHVAPISAAARLIGVGVPAALDMTGIAKYPIRNGNPSTIPWITETGAIPVVSRELGNITVGPSRKVAIISALSEELAARSDGEAAITQILREDAAWTLDAAYFATTAGSSSAHAGLLNGVTPIEASSIGGPAAMTEDLVALASAVTVGGSGQVAFVVSTDRAAIMPIITPDLNVTILPSPAVAATRIIAVDPLSLVHATDPNPDIAASKDAVLHMEDTSPAQISTPGTPATVAAPVRSVFQTGSIALRVILEMAWAKRRSTAVAYIDNPDWSAA